MDANACIIHALNLGKVEGTPLHDYYCTSVRCFVTNCPRESISIGTFPKVKDHSNKNITKAVVQLARKRGFGKEYYVMEKLKDIGTSNLARLFSVLVEYPETYTEDQIKEIETFYSSIQKDIGTYTDPNKSSMPEQHDLEFFASAHNLEPEIVHIISDDAHFAGYVDEIAASPYGLRVFPVKDLNRIMIDLKWPMPT